MNKRAKNICQENILPSVAKGNVSIYSSQNTEAAVH